MREVMIQTISNFIIPGMILGVIGYGLYKRCDVYDDFIDGAKEGFATGIEIFPSLIGMILAINIFLHGSFLDYFFAILKPVFDLLRFPIEVLPMAVMRPISGSSSLVLMTTIFQQFGVDSLLGNLAAVIQGSTDTTLYVLALYFGSIGIKKIRYALWAGLFADLCGIVASLVIVSCFF